MSNLTRLLNPRTITVIGGKECERVVEQCDKLGFKGEIWPVHPKRESIGGRACVRSVDDLPAVPDAAYIAVNRERSIEVVQQLAAMGAGGAVCYAAGFAEADGESEGAEDLQYRLVQAAGEMPIIGPNCYGFVNALERVALWPDQHGCQPVESGVAILTQSSNVAINLTMQKRGLPIAQVMTVGNQAQQGLSALGMALLADERVTALGLHIEGLDDVASFEALANFARQSGKPIVAIKVGKSQQAQAAAMTHTASLAGSQSAHVALFERLGIARTDSLEAFLETLKLFHCHRALPGNQFLSLSCSGGEASLIADAADGKGVVFPPFSETNRAALKSHLGPIVTIANPLDYNTFIWGDWPAMTAMFEAALAQNFDLALLVMDFPRADLCDPQDWLDATEAFVRAVKNCNARAAVVSSLPETMPEEIAARLLAEGIAPMCGLEATIAASQSAAWVGQAWLRPSPEPLLILPSTQPGGQDESAGPIALDEASSKNELANCGLVVPKGVVISDMNDVDVALKSLEFPLAVKALGIAHKTEVGAVRLGIGDSEALLRAVSSLSALSNRFLIEEMAPKPLAELIIGVTVDPVVGLVMTVGAGGVLTELLADTTTLLFPMHESDVREALSRLKIGKLLEGYRASEAADIDALVANILCIAKYAETHAAQLQELDVNPLFATQLGSIAVDALIIKKDPV